MEQTESGGPTPVPEKATAEEGGFPRNPAPARAPGPPLPVRSAVGPVTAAAPGAAAPVPHPDGALEVDGVRWAVRELGRAGSPKIPLLLLGFFHPDEPEEPRREALVAARGLEGLTELELEAAWRAGRAHVRAGTRRPFFPEITARGGKEG